LRRSRNEVHNVGTQWAGGDRINSYRTRFTYETYERALLIAGRGFVLAVFRRGREISTGARPAAIVLVRIYGAHVRDETIDRR